jgi:hypothetical protein
VAVREPQTFSGIAPAQFAKLVQKANAAGVSMAGNSGSASKMGVEVAWNYSEEKQVLELTCLRTPFFVRADDINAKLRDLVNETLAS